MPTESRNAETIVLHGGSYRADPATTAVAVPILGGASGRLASGTLSCHRRMLTLRPDRTGLRVREDHLPGQHAVVRTPQRPSAGRRLAAAVAIAAVIAAAVLLLIGIATHLAAVVLALIALLIGATSSWYAVSRRGAVRVIAVVVVVASLAGFGISLFFADLRIWRVVLIVVLGGVSVLAARYALVRTGRQLHAGSAQLVPVGRPAHPVLMMIPKSGGERSSASTSPRSAASAASSRSSWAQAMI